MWYVFVLCILYRLANFRGICMCGTLSKYLQKIASSIDLVKRYHFSQVLPPNWKKILKPRDVTRGSSGEETRASFMNPLLRRFSVVIPSFNSKAWLIGKHISVAFNLRMKNFFIHFACIFFCLVRKRPLEQGPEEERSAKRSVHDLNPVCVC